MERFPLPWRALQNALGGDLSAGVYALVGPIGSGKTQLALQIALCGAERGAPVALSAPRIDPKELRARLEGIRTRTDWSQLSGEEHPVPGSIEILGALPSNGARLVVIDPFFEDQTAILTRARRLAIDEQTITMLVVEPRSQETVKTFVPQEVLRRSPAEIAAWTGVASNVAAEVDGLLVLAPDRPRSSAEWMTVEIAIAKHRRGVPGRAVLRFNGLWFEDEPTELDLGI